MPRMIKLLEPINGQSKKEVKIVLYIVKEGYYFSDTDFTDIGATLSKIGKVDNKYCPTDPEAMAVETNKSDEFIINLLNKRFENIDVKVLSLEEWLRR